MLTVIGEGLVDVVQRASGIEAHVGGSPLNVAVGLARLDHPVQFIGRYGRDAYGDSVAAHLRASSVMVPMGPDDLPTSVATALIDDDGAATYTFDLPGSFPASPTGSPSCCRAPRCCTPARSPPCWRRAPRRAGRRRIRPPARHHQLRPQLPAQHHHRCGLRAPAGRKVRDPGGRGQGLRRGPRLAVPGRVSFKPTAGFVVREGETGLGQPLEAPQLGGLPFPPQVPDSEKPTTGEKHSKDKPEQGEDDAEAGYPNDQDKGSDYGGNGHQDGHDVQTRRGCGPSSSRTAADPARCPIRPECRRRRSVPSQSRSSRDGLSRCFQRAVWLASVAYPSLTPPRLYSASRVALRVQSWLASSWNG